MKNKYMHARVASDDGSGGSLSEQIAFITKYLEEKGLDMRREIIGYESSTDNSVLKLIKCKPAETDSITCGKRTKARIAGKRHYVINNTQVQNKRSGCKIPKKSKSKLIKNRS